MKPSLEALEGRGPYWSVPMEAVRYLATSAGMLTLTRLGLEDVKFQATAVMWRRKSEFAATVTFESPKDPGLRQEAVILLTPDLRENAR